MFDESRNPPPRNRLDRFIRRFRYPAYFIALITLYMVASTAIGLALAPALWLLSHWIPWTDPFPGWLRCTTSATTAAGIRAACAGTRSRSWA